MNLRNGNRAARPVYLVGTMLLVGLASCESKDDEPGTVPAKDAAAESESAVQDASAESVTEQDASQEPEAAAEGGQEETAAEAVQLSWQPLRLPEDSEGDCEVDDPECAADFKQLYWAVEGSTIYFDVTHYKDFPAAQGSWEILLIPRDQLVPGHSLQLIQGAATWWTADCSSGVEDPDLRHAGCHWTNDAVPGTVLYDWVSPDRMMLQMPLGEVLPTGKTELLVGLGGAPFAVKKTAEYTDRYPDEMLVTPNEVQGLAPIVVKSPE